MKKILLFAYIFLLLAFPCHADRIGVLVEEIDGSPAGYAYKLKITNGALSLTGGVGTITVSGSDLTEEQVEDYVGGMLGGTETLISVTYQDETGDIDFVVDSDLHKYSWTNVTTADFTALASWAGTTSLAIGDTAFTDLSAGDSYTNFSTSADDDTIDELFAAIDTALGGKQATVTEGSLTDGVIVSGDIKDGTIAAGDLANALRVTTQTSNTLGDNGELVFTAGYDRVYVDLTVTADDADIDIDEGGSEVDGTIVVITNLGSNTARFADEAGEVELTAPCSLEQYETLTLQYKTDRWVEIARATNALGFGTINTVETEYLPIAYAIDGASAPDALATVTSGTDKVDCRTFAGDADEDVLITWQVPLDCDVTSGIKFRVICFVTAATGPSAETWQFELQGFSLGDGDALDGTLGTAQTSNSGSRSDAQYDRVATAWSSAMTSDNITNLAVGETVVFKLYRDVDDTDTYEQLIGVAGIELKYKRDHDTTF